METEMILEKLPELQATAEGLRNVLLANLVMIGEIPSPTFGEEQRAAMLRQRFSECGLEQISVDEKLNTAAIIPGAAPDAPYIMITAHLDTVFPAEADHTVTVEAEHVTGRGLADNSLGAAMLATIPTLIESAELGLESNILLLGDARSLGQANLEGINFFLDHNPLPIKSAICLEGVDANRINYSSIDMFRGEITCVVPEDHQWTKYGPASAIMLLNEVINEIQRIPYPNQPRTTINIGQISGGTTFNQIPMEAMMRFEIRSEGSEMAEAIGKKVGVICEEIASRSGAEVHLETVATRKCGGLAFDHPLVLLTKDIHEKLRIDSQTFPSMSELAACISHDIPAVTLGITNGRNINTRRERLEINPIFPSMAEMLGVLLAMEGDAHEQG